MAITAKTWWFPISTQPPNVLVDLAFQKVNLFVIKKQYMLLCSFGFSIITIKVKIKITHNSTAYINIWGFPLFSGIHTHPSVL
jgi:hypothetical protein